MLGSEEKREKRDCVVDGTTLQRLVVTYRLDPTHICKLTHWLTHESSHDPIQQHNPPNPSA